MTRRMERRPAVAGGETRAQRRERILAEAAKLIARFGLRKTSLDDIAKKFGMQKTSLYYYFKSKDELIGAVIRRESDVVLAEIRRAIKKHDLPQDKLRAFFHTRFRYIREIAELYQLSSEQLAEIGALIEKHRHGYFESERALILEILRAGNRRGVFAVENVELVALAILSSLQGLAPAVARHKNDLEEVYDSVIQVLFHGIMKR